jgi:hypothetical protein
MTPVLEAIRLYERDTEDFDAAIARHMHGGYVWTSPECFILALVGWRVDEEYFEECQEGDALFVSCAVGEIRQFVQMAPRAESIKWLGFRRGLRKPDGPTHWLDFQALRRRYAI